MVQRIPYAGYDPSTTKHPGAVDLTDEAVLRDQRQRATIKALEQAMCVITKLAGPYAAKAGGR